MPKAPKSRVMSILYLALGAFILGGGVIAATNALSKNDDSEELVMKSK